MPDDLAVHLTRPRPLAPRAASPGLLRSAGWRDFTDESLRTGAPGARLSAHACAGRRGQPSHVPREAVGEPRRRAGSPRARRARTRTRSRREPDTPSRMGTRPHRPDRLSADDRPGGRTRVPGDGHDRRTPPGSGPRHEDRSGGCSPTTRPADGRSAPAWPRRLGGIGQRGDRRARRAHPWCAFPLALPHIPARGSRCSQRDAPSQSAQPRPSHHPHRCAGNREGCARPAAADRPDRSRHAPRESCAAAGRAWIPRVLAASAQGCRGSAPAPTPTRSHARHGGPDGAVARPSSAARRSPLGLSGSAPDRWLGARHTGPPFPGIRLLEAHSLEDRPIADRPAAPDRPWRSSSTWAPRPRHGGGTESAPPNPRRRAASGVAGSL
jgi:hypothetical protein